ncbi:hypothetical protein [Sulfurimonas microaerophilic]|uniref:hypothetical protein n=1 Tax=Sulfurimonas microaerophilic TaxID=3058392 RepID=UPI00271480DD|nr:hypothetical protein [Sulfurimonas sp. hsl 1-7]
MIEITIKNDYLLKSELTLRIFSLIIFILLLYFLIQKIAIEKDSLDLLMYKAGLVTSIIGVFSSFFYGYKQLYKLLSSTQYILIDKESLSYDFVLNNGDIDKYIMQLNKINIGWSYFPIFGEIEKIKLKKKTLNNKVESFIGTIGQSLLNMIFLSVYFIIQFFKFKKYYILNDDKIVLAIPMNDETVKLINKKVPFSKLTLRHNLLIKNSSIFK